MTTTTTTTTTTTPNREQGPSTEAGGGHVDQDAGAGQGLGEGGAADDSTREVGVTAAVERGPAELSSERDPVPDSPHIALENRKLARSTDDL